MATKIEWTHGNGFIGETWNPTTGCTRVSAGCDACYAARMTRRLEAMGQGDYSGLTTTKHFNGTVRCLEHKLDIPLRWRKPRMVFVNSMSDLFHKDVPFEFIAAVFGVMACCQSHTFQILTKRPERMPWFLEWLEKQATPHTTEVAIAQHHAQRKCGADELRHGERFAYWTWPLPNVWLGTSVENQQTADERIPHLLLRCPAAVRFLSCEPLLSAVDLSTHLGLAAKHDDLRGLLHWVIVGGESGPGARPCQLAWIRSIVDQCSAAGVACFVKQLGARPVDDGRKLALRDRKGGDMSEWPADLRVRQFPKGL